MSDNRNSSRSATLGVPAALLIMCATAVLVGAAVFWPAKKPTEPQWLGMEVEPLSTDVRAALGLHPDQRGVFVSDVVGIASDAGVREGDVIVSVNRAAVTGVESYRSAARALRDTSSVRLGVLRRGALLGIVVGSHPGHAGAPTTPAPAQQVALGTGSYSVVAPGRSYQPAALPGGCATCPLSAAPVALPGGCATCPNAAACLPPNVVSRVALTPGCAACPNAGVCFPPGRAAPVALPGGCATCPNAAACLPPPASPVALTTPGCTTGTCPIR